MIDYCDIIRKSGVHVKVLGKKSGVSYNTINGWLHQGRAPTLHNLIAVLQVIGYDIIATPMGENK
jgi:transcriptional regulator with XRE-family HTH domain